MLQFDASSIIFAWDTYPIEVFPPLWNWVKGQFMFGQFLICQVALDEVGHISPECHSWLKECRPEILPVTEEVLFEALKIKSLLGIEEDQYHTKGVDENDILIIACAKVHDHILISNEAVQTTPQQDRKKLKIPAVCKEVEVECVDFTKYLKQNSQSFG